jgi:hypothetical protein
MDRCGEKKKYLGLTGVQTPSVSLYGLRYSSTIRVTMEWCGAAWIRLADDRTSIVPF